MTTITPQLARQPTDLDSLFRQYHRELNRFAYGKLRDREAASDLVQDAFLRFLSHGQSGPGATVPISPRFFLWRIASNLIIDMTRRERRRGAFVPLDALADELADPTPSADRRLAARQEFLIIKHTLDALSPKARAALLLNRIEGLSHAEIADRLGISSSMVSKHIMNALRRCAEQLEALGC